MTPDRLVWLLLLLLGSPLTGLALELESRAPDFTLKGVDGRNVRFADYIGQVRVLVFTSQKCGACKRTFATVEKALPGVEGKGVQAWGVSRDRYASTARRRAKEDGVGIPVLHDEHGRTSFQYGVTELPTLLLVDRDGRLRGAWTGREARMPEDFATILESVAAE
jgi:peroxiredoxin